MYNEKVLLERCYFVLYNDALTLKISKMALNPFCDKAWMISLAFLSRRPHATVDCLSHPGGALL